MSCPSLTAPLLDGRTREARAVAATRAELERRLGLSPTFEAKQTAEQILRAVADIGLLQRKRHEQGGLGVRDSEFLIRLENSLARLLDRLERLAPPPTAPSIAEQLRAERQAATA